MTGKKDIKWEQQDPGSAMERGLDPAAGPGLRPVGGRTGCPLRVALKGPPGTVRQYNCNQMKCNSKCITF